MQLVQRLASELKQAKQLELQVEQIPTLKPSPGRHYVQALLSKEHNEQLVSTQGKHVETAAKPKVGTQALQNEYKVEQFKHIESRQGKQDEPFNPYPSLH